MKTLKSVWIVGLALVCALAQAQAQNGTYRLKSEDVIRIVVYNQADISATLIIGPDGNISAPFLGTMRAEGKTATELANELAEAYKLKLGLRDPIVTVIVDRFREIRATVTGQVNTPGVFEMKPGDTILTLYTRGGGQMRDNSTDMRRAKLRRKGSNELIPIDLYAMLVKGDMSQNYEVEDGDELILPEETMNRIIVMGRVQAPGPYGYREPMMVMDAIAMARGEIEFRSKLSAVRVIRRVPGKETEFVQIETDLVRFLKNGEAAQNIALEPGDIVFVPDSGNINFNQINSIANILFILDRFGFGITPLGGF